MTADQLKTLTTDALDTLAALLDEGHSDRLTALLKTMGRFHKYSWHNVALIATQCPTATHVAGFQTWRTMGRFVRKGEKGIAILAPIVGRRNADADQDDSKRVLGFRAAYVFDVAKSLAAAQDSLPGARNAAVGFSRYLQFYKDLYHLPQVQAALQGRVFVEPFTTIREKLKYFGEGYQSPLSEEECAEEEWVLAINTNGDVYSQGDCYDPESLSFWPYQMPFSFLHLR
jgi:hypothetical protein